MKKNKPILITGGTGAMGSVLVKKLTSLGYPVRVITIPDDPLVNRLEGTGADIRYGNIANVNDLKNVCDNIDTVIHCAAIIITNDDSLYKTINAEGTANVVSEAKRAGVSHFVHISSASVLYPKPTPYSQSKMDAEKIVIESGISWTMIRPTLVYGERGGQEFDMFIDYLCKFPVVPFIGNGESIKRPVYVEDIIDGLLTIAQLTTGKNKIYNFSGASKISIIDFSKLCLVLMNKGNRQFVHIPVPVCIALANLLKRVMKNPPLKWSVIAGITQDADLDPTEAISDLGYKPSELMNRLPHCFPRK